MTNPLKVRVPNRSALRRAVAAMALIVAASTGGCVNISAMISKMVLGDPQIDASFKQQTGVTLDDKHPVLVFCTAPASVADDHSSIAYDLQKQISNRMELHKIKVIESSRIWRAVDDKGGRTDPQSLATMFPEAEYLIMINLGGFDCVEPNSPNLLRGYAGGIMRGYAVRASDSGRFASQIFEKEFQVEHPSHPVPRDSISQNTFEKQFLDHLSDELGRVLYDFRTSELF